jgi:hypothetical protein
MTMLLTQHGWVVPTRLASRGPHRGSDHDKITGNDATPTAIELRRPLACELPPHQQPLDGACGPASLFMSFPASDEKRDAMANERTPLIQTVEVRPYVRDRYPHHRLRSVCTALLAATIVIGGAVAIILFTFAPLNDGSEYDASLRSWSAVSGNQHSQTLSFEELQDILLETPDADQAREWSQYYTSGPHLAGKNLTQALWTKDRWQEFGIKSVIVDYDVYLNYPKSHRLALLEKRKGNDSAAANDWSVKYEARLEENVLKEDKSSQLEDRVPTFHGYSASGNVTAPYVFVNYGTYQDFEDLQAAKISLKGKIALAKYGGVFRGLKVKRAQELGMIGVVMYTDPGDDRDVTEKNGVAAYPEGPAREPSSVQRGSVQFLSKIRDPIKRQPTNTIQALLLETLQRQATPPNPGLLVFQSITPSHRFPRYLYHTKMRFLCSRPSMAMDQRLLRSTSHGTAVASIIRV